MVLSFLRVKFILQKIGAVDFLKEFQENYVDDGVLELLTEEHLRTILPLGIAIRFAAVLKTELNICADNVRSIKHTNPFFSSSQDTQVVPFSPSSQGSPLILVGQEQLSLGQDNNFSPNISLAENDSNCPAYAKSSNIIDQRKPVAHENIDSQVCSGAMAICSGNLTPSLSKSVNFSTVLENSNCNGKTFIKQNSSSSFINKEENLQHICSLENSAQFKGFQKMSSITSAAKLKDILESYYEGQNILSFYNQNQFLNKQFSLSLCDIIMKHELRNDPSRRLMKNDFMTLCECIQGCFPNEVIGTYYLPSRKIRKRMISSRGRLVEKYHNFRRKLRSCGLLDSTKKSKSPEMPLTVLLNESVQTALDWLKSNDDPEHTLMHNWEITSEFRLAKLSSIDQNQAILDYFTQFPGLQNPNSGFKMILSDFKKLYPNNDNAFFLKWESTAEAILKYTKEHLSRDKRMKKAVELAGVDLNVCEPEAVKISALCLLPFLFPCSRNLKMKDSRPWKPSKTECAESFIFKVSSIDNFKATLIAKKELMNSIKQICEPLLITIGPPNNVSGCFVNIHETFYCFPSLMVAFDFCFKSFFALNIQYPREVYQPFLFIQKFVYGIVTKNDVSSQNLINLGKALNLGI